MRISVIVTPAEHAKIKAAAGFIPLSAYLKACALEKVAEGKLPYPGKLGGGESAIATKNGARKK
jgi:hypothetical protein